MHQIAKWPKSSKGVCNKFYAMRFREREAAFPKPNKLSETGKKGKKASGFWVRDIYFHWPGFTFYHYLLSCVLLATHNLER